MKRFNGNCDKVPSIKAAKLDITAKLMSLGLEPVDVPTDGNCFLHAASFALLQRNDWNINVVPTVVKTRANVTRFLTTAHMHVIWDGRTLDEVRGEMTDPVMVGK